MTVFLSVLDELINNLSNYLALFSFNVMRLGARDFHRVMVDEVASRIDFHTEIESE